MIRRCERLKGRPDRVAETLWVRQERPEAREQRQTAALQASRRADAGQVSHQQAEIERACLQQHAFQDVLVPRRCTRRIRPVS